MNKLKTRRYLTVNDIHLDFKLLVTNCISYNGSGHELVECARKLAANFKARLELLNVTDNLPLFEFSGTYWQSTDPPLLLLTNFPSKCSCTF